MSTARRVLGHLSLDVLRARGSRPIAPETTIRSSGRDHTDDEVDTCSTVPARVKSFVREGDGGSPVSLQKCQECQHCQD